MLRNSEEEVFTEKSTYHRDFLDECSKLNTLDLHYSIKEDILIKILNNVLNIIA